MVPLDRRRLSLEWVVLRDSSGWHRTKHVMSLLAEERSQAVCRFESYLDACGEAEKLNVVEEVCSS